MSELVVVRYEKMGIQEDLATEVGVFVVVYCDAN